MIPFLLGLALAAQAPAESDYYVVDYLTPPEGVVVEVGGMAFLNDGRLAVSTRRGQIWLIRDALSPDPADAKWSLLIEGLHEGLGLNTLHNDLVVLQRGELTQLSVPNDNERCTSTWTLANDWGLSSNYHEFAFGLPRDEKNNFYISLNVGFADDLWYIGKAFEPYRGWVMKITPEGKSIPFATGFRSPCGIGFGANGELFVTDNQGDWLPASPIHHVKEGKFYGHPAGLDWTPEYMETKTQVADYSPPPRAATDREPAALWLPYKWSRSPGNLVPDATGGKFGAFEGQVFVAELTNGMVLRADFETVQGVTQGWCTLFRQQIGSVNRVIFAEDGTLFTGLTNRGWGGLAPADGLARVRWTGKTPFEIHDIHLLQDGFELTFTEDLGDALPPPEDIVLTQYDYDYWWEYGSPERHTRRVPVASVELGVDERSLILRVEEDGLVPGMMARCLLPKFKSKAGTPLLHEEFAYTINQLPGAEFCRDHIAKIAPPPPPKDSDETGWLRLCYGDAFDRWNSDGWELVDVALDPTDPTKLMTRDGVGALVNSGSEAPGDFRSKHEFGDGTLHAEFLLPRGGSVSVLLQDRYEMLLAATEPDGSLDLTVCGAMLPGPEFQGAPPVASAFTGEGVWQVLDVEFEAPRFDENGKKIANARVVRAVLNGTEILSGVQLTGPSAGGAEGERALAPLTFRSKSSAAALGNIRFKPVYDVPNELELEAAGWRWLFEDDSIEDWSRSGDAQWTAEFDTIFGTGKTGHLFSPEALPDQFELHAEVQIADNGNSGLYFHTMLPEEGETWPRGYEAQINSNYPDPQHTGGLYNLAPVSTQLVAPGTTFHMDVRCENYGPGRHIQIRINGVLITDFTEKMASWPPGHVALQQHHEGSAVQFRDLRVRAIR